MVGKTWEITASILTVKKIAFWVLPPCPVLGEFPKDLVLVFKETVL